MTLPDGTLIDYLVLGHVTRDLLPGGASAPGGTAFYAGAAAARLGASVGVLTSARADDLPAAPKGVAITAVHARATTTFENRYGPAGRYQWLHALADPLSLAAVPPAWRTAPVVHLAPVVAEVELALIGAFPDALVGVTPQGWMRAWDEPLPAPVRPALWRPAAELLRRVHLLVLSIEDVGGDEALVAGYARDCPLVALTRGAAGATLFVAGEPHAIKPFPAREQDPTGAGDVFAAAMLLRLYETGDPFAAAAFASAAAAISVEGAGHAALPSRTDTQARMAATL
ncbi:MAG: PfkB family carbohydrate kinase [Chloroflexi bacterium OHK40]